jgi:hypothetical protein
MLCPLRNTFRKTHESSRKPIMKPVYPPYNFVAGGIKTTNLKPGHGITLMHILDLSGKILENTVL